MVLQQFIKRLLKVSRNGFEKMKFHVILCCLVFISRTSGAPQPSGKEMLASVVTQCLAEEGGSEGDLASIMKGQFPESPAGHCMITCIQEKCGMVWSLQFLRYLIFWYFLSLKFKDGKLDRNGFYEMGKILTNNDENALSHVNQLADLCEPSIIGKKRCEQGINFQTCLHAELTKMNIKIDMF